MMLEYLLHSYYLLWIIPIVIIIAFLIKKNFVQFKDMLEKKHFLRTRVFDRILIMFTRIIIACLLVIALASPYIYEEITEKGDPSLKVLIDRSGSFGIFEQDIDKQIMEKIGGKIPITIVEIESGNRTSIGNAIRNNMQGNDNILLVTDAYSNEGWYLSDAILFAQNQNTVINALDIQPKYDDLAVFIEGPSKILQGAEEEFFIQVNQVGQASGSLRVTIDGNEIISTKVSKESSFSFKKSFRGGDHKIIAQLEADDYFPQNNIYYKTIHSVEKPNLLLVTKQSSPLKSILDQLYDLEVRSSLPSRLDQYHMIIFDDIKESEINSRVKDLKEYLEDGNGILYVGGKTSFEFNDQCNPKKSPSLQNCLVHSILPVNVGYGAEEEFKDVNVVFVIDISGSTGESFSSAKQDDKVAVEKALALELLNDMKQEYRVGVVVFNHGYNLVSDLKPLYDNPNLNRTIAKLQFSGGTVVYQGLKKAHDLFTNVGGSKNVILISDGLTSYPEQAIQKAEEMAKSGITVYALGVGENTNSQFMSAIAEKGNGVFYQPTETQKIKIALDMGEEQKLNKFNLEVMNRNSFITNNLDLNAYLVGLNQVVPKGAAKVLVATEKNSPILTTWRFSLGRAAVLSTDNGNKWSGPLYSGANSKLITRTINWLVGDPDRVKSYSISVKDTYMGEPTDINVISEKMPSLPGYEFSKTELGEKDLYSAAFNPATTGIFKFDRTIAAVNYHKEYQRLGLNPELKTLVQNSGGGFFKIEESDALVKKVKEDSVTIKNDMKFYRWPFIIAALAVLIIEIAVRRFRENYLMSRR